MRYRTTRRLNRWFWLRLLHMAPRDIVDLHGHLQAVDESVQHLAYCVGEALAQIPGEHLASPYAIFEEEWGK